MARKEQFIWAVVVLVGLFPIYTNEVVVFGQSSYSVSLAEEPDPDVVITELTALDTDRSGGVIFSVGDDNFGGGIVVFANKTSDSNNLLYDVNLLVGPNVTQSSFDYDERQRVVILIRADNTAGQSATTRVIVNLIDVNDNPPVFPPMIVINVPENAPVNESIGVIEAMDEDSGINGFVAYQQHPDLQSDVFMVQTDGEVILLQSLDYETQREYQLTVMATDHGSPVMLSTGEVMIMVTDVNDRNPLFDLSSYSAQVYENRTMGSVILQVSAYDGDEGINDVISYSIDDTSGTFTINSSTGHIILSDSLDREATSSYDITVTATEMMAATSHNSTRIAITILDVNDNYPMFRQPQYNISINETDQVDRIILTVIADDADEGENARIIYRIINQSIPFAIRDANTGGITVTMRLDYETQQMYIFDVLAEDSSDTVMGSGSLQSATTVIINLNNINDEFPQFVNAPYDVMIMEHSDEGSPVVMLNVTDRDIGSGGIVEVSITSNEDIFEIVNDFEIIVKNSSLLDYEVASQYSITVVATDMGAPPLSNTSTVVVSLINQNDNIPSITCHSVQVTEGLVEGSFVTTINASDDDGDALRFMINVNQSHPAGVEQYFNFSGNQLVTSSMTLDYEQFTEVVLSIAVTDGVHNSNCSIYINITDINDNDPVFFQPTQFIVPEDTEIESVIGAVNVTDEDSGVFAIVNYSLNDTSFAINSTTGELYLARSLDYEQQEVYLVIVTAVDNPGGTVSNMNSEVITIRVEDANDNRPLFTQSVYRESVYENASVFSYRVTATDSDTGSNAELTYHILSSNVNITGLLTIDQSSGIICKMGASSFDRETTGNINLTVVAYDNGTPQLNGTAQVLIILLDINEHPPVFDQSNYTFDVFENVTAGSIVDTISATDMDEGTNAMVSYTLTSVNVPFRLDRNNPGDVFVNGPLNREVLSNYTLHITATDSIVTTSTVVYINILDVNDNPPRFTERSYRRTVQENIMPESSLITVTATDNDIPPNNIICYSILAEDGMSTPTEISINNRSGEITVKSELDYDQDGFEPTILTYIYATDNPSCEDDGDYFTDFVTLLLTVTDVNDNCPQFVGTDDSDNNSFVAFVSEGSGMADQFNTNIAITDADDGDFGSITLTTNSTDFAVRLSDQDLLIIEILTELDREIIDNYIILVNASDGGGCSSYINLIINLVDVNERPPVFNSSDGYTTHIAEGNYQQYVVYTGILAEDMETDGRTIIMYHLQDQWAHPLFSVNQTTGVVTVNGNIDRETNRSFVLTIIAYEEAMPMNQSSTTTLTILVDDVNDNAPVISSCSSDSVPETDIIGNPILTVVAGDDDVGELFYYIEDFSNTFTINVTTGVIATNSILDYEGVRQFNFTITVSDLLYNISEDCSIMLEDVNDNAPQFIAGCCNDVNITENAVVGTLLPVVITATDADSGPNGQVELSSMFSFIDKFELLQNGSINVTGVLDYETQSKYTLLVLAKDMASPESRLTSNITIVVQLKNENDNDPSFNSSVYEFSMDEHSPNATVVGQVIVSDADGGPVTLRVLNGPFLVDDNGMLTSNAGVNFFDYDNLPIYYHFTIIASDEDDRRDTANVVVSIVDINDNSPLFTQHYNTTLALGSYSNQPLLALVASDEDSSSNGRISYSIQSDNSGGMFQVNNITGLLTVNGLFNMSMVYSLIVLAMDHGNPPLSDTTIVIINVIEQTGDLRFVNASYNFDILENISVDDEIIMFSVEGAQQYFLATNISHFMINSSSGVLTVASSLDYERDAHMYIFTVGAVSMTRSTALAMVTINLIDVNDNAPVFVDSSGAQAYVAEGRPENTTVYTLSTVDADSINNSNTGYLIIPSNVSSLFSITILGQLLVNGSLDRESASQYQLTIIAYDIEIPSLNNTINITVNVLDSNDHYPVFTKPFYVASINEAASNGTKVVTIVANDQDDDVNGDITFTIIDGDSGGHFTIANTKSCEGTIYTNGIPTDRELNSMINLTVQASDRGSPPRTNTTTVIITLLDINDNAPILNTTGPFDVTENTSIGMILTLSTYDEDLLDNGYGVVSYFLDEDYNGLFSLNVTTGELIITNTLDRETVPIYNLTVMLRDTPSDGSQVNINSFIVVINVVDVNDNDPLFVPITMPLRISEMDAQGMVVVTITATDNDEGSNADIIISIVSITPNNSNEPFRIETISLSGIANLIVSSQLDRELIPLYNIVVKATDMGTPVRSSVMNFNVLVTDVNDNAPVFTMRQFSFTVPEDVSIGFNVGTLSAIDLDDSTLQYGFEFNFSQFFDIGEMDGVVSVAGTLDREANSTYRFMARVSDRVNREDTAEVVITVMDVNDNAPQFTSHLYNGSIEEDSLPSVTVMIQPQINATDYDQMNTPNSQVTYSLQSGQGAEYFQMDRDTAHVVVSLVGHNNLDYETVQQFNLTVQAVDGGNPSLSSTARLLISITDVNDNPPVFTRQQFTVAVTEEQPVNGMLLLPLTVTANDNDSDAVNGAISYSISAGNTDVFALNHETGQLFAIRQIDAEESDLYNLTVVARDGSSPYNSATASIVIIVQDINDNAPQFNASLFMASVSETAKGEATEEQYVTTLGITDVDRGLNNSKLSITVLSDKFLINQETHHLFTKPANNGTLDRENSPTEQFVVIACDQGGVEQQCSNATVIVTLLDVNDNEPQFDQSNYTLTIRQSQLVGSTVGVFIAQDQDIGNNGELCYSLQTNVTEEIFHINPVTGSLMLNQSISPNFINNSIELIITASDQGVPSRSGNVTVIVMIFEELGIVPVFNQSLYNISIIEGSQAGTHVVTVSASSTISNIQYFIDLPIGFTIDRNTGNITTTVRLNRESATSYSFGVRASNNEANGYSLVVVIVIDANDHSPQFENLPYVFSVVENNEISQLIDHIIATDQDSGINAELQYSIIRGNENNLFNINPYNGSLYANQSLDREEMSSYIITVMVTDMGMPPLNATTNVTIIILDQNDNSPVIQHITVFSGDHILSMDNTSIVVIPEDHPPYTSFIQFNVTDPDEDNNGNFVFSLQDDSDNFFIDGFQGRLQNIRELDFESRTSFSLTIVIMDRGQQSRSIEHSVIVNISDVNDCIPDFGFATSSRFTRIDEELPNGTLIMNFTATDCDSGNNGLIQYTITDGNEEGHFAINSTGHLTANVILDREEVSEYTLVITAADLGDPILSSSVELTVELIDMNDNAPQFESIPQSVNVSESISLSSIVTTVSATDNDESSTVSYLITSDVFAISSTGVVTLEELLDRELVSWYNVTITATDGENSNVTQLIVIVEDVNDNSPVFSNTSCLVTVFVQEHVNNSLVHQVSATDIDEGINNKIVYSFINAQDRIRFTLNSTTGQIYTRGSLDHEIQSIYNLDIRAEDQAISQRRMAFCTVFVEVEDINDNPPQFLQDVYFSSVLENNLSSNILTVSATDEDTTTNNVLVQYTFSDDLQYPGRFFINPDSGIIRNVVQLDREDVSVYNMTVIGTNAAGIPSLNDTTIVIITVLDVNEFPPMFVSPPNRVNVSEIGATESILQLTATDMDDNPNVDYSYTLLTRISNSPFNLGSTDGRLLLTGTLDFEQRSHYNLIFEVSDGERSSNTSVVIEVIDENDNVPYFDNVDADGFIRASVLEGESDVVITRLIIDDADTDKINTDSTVHLVSAIGVTNNMDARDHFELDALTGNLKVSVNMSLDREENEFFILNVTVNNTRSGSGVGCFLNSNSCNLISAAELLVTVNDTNDNPPIFTRSIYNGDITTTVGIGQRVVQVEATDKDKLFGPIVYELNIKSGNALNLFGIDKTSGEVVTQASFLNSVGENFTFTVVAKDNGGIPIYHSAEATITVIVLDNLQRVVITFQCIQSLIVPQANNIKSALENITGYFINLESVEPHYERDRTTGERLTSNTNLTDFVFYAVDRTTNKIVEGEDVIRVLANRINLLEDVLSDGCKVQSAQAVQELLIASKKELTSLQVVLIILAGLIGSGGLLMLCLSYRQRYVGTHLKRDQYKANIFYGRDALEDIERHKITTHTENYEMVGEPITQNQPMIVQPYQDWSQSVNVEKRSNATKQTLRHDNPLYESQEIRMEMFADMSETDFSEEDEAGLLAAAIADEDEEEDADELVTAI